MSNDAHSDPFRVTVYASSSERVDPGYRMIAEDLGNGNTAAAAYQQIVVMDASITNGDRARMETLDALTDVRAERRTMGINCSK